MPPVLKVASIRFQKRMKSSHANSRSCAEGKRVLLGIAICGTLFLSSWILIFGFPAFRQFWNLPEETVNFVDSRTLTSGAESHALGYDPMYENIAHPHAREMNYPRIWHGLFWLPIKSEHTALLAGIFALLFFWGVFLFLHAIDTRTALFLGAMVFSPAAIFGLQSGNNDLVVFFVAALALRLGYRSKFWGATAMFFAAVLKVFPIFGLVAQLLTEEKRDFYRLLLPFAALFLLYCYVSLDEFRHIYSITPWGRSGAYGMPVLPMMIEKVLNKWTAFPELRAWVIAAAPVFFFGVACAICLISICALVAKRAVRCPISEPHIASFRVGAYIYIGSFLISNNWDYRLIFLIFTIPQLVAWSSSADIWLSRMVRVTLAGILFSCWAIFVQGIFGSYIFILDEIANWIAFSGLLHLFLASLPGWSFDELSEFFGRT